MRIPRLDPVLLLASACLAAAALGSVPAWLALGAHAGADLFAAPAWGTPRGLAWVVLGLWSLAVLPPGLPPIRGFFRRLLATDGGSARWVGPLLPGAILGWFAVHSLLVGPRLGVLAAPLALVALGLGGRAALGPSARPPLAVGVALGWRYAAMVAPMTAVALGWGGVAALAATLPAWVLSRTVPLATLGVEPVLLRILGGTGAASAVLPLLLAGFGAAALSLCVLPAHVARHAQRDGALTRG
ncbi:MAG: hypothetical protein R3F59_01145 [Myxococcota bacterium]